MEEPSNGKQYFISKNIFFKGTITVLITEVSN